jgi:hypothetical protein
VESRGTFFYICTTKLGAWCADNAIPHDLGRYHVGCACGEFIGVIDEVATNGYSHTVRVVLLWAMIDDYSRVGDAVFGNALDLVMREKKDSVSTAGNAFFALCQAMELFRHRRDPKFFQEWIVHQFGVFCNGLLGDRVHHAVAYFFDVDDVPKTIGGFEKGSRDGVRGGRIESKIDDMVEGLA